MQCIAVNLWNLKLNQLILLIGRKTKRLKKKSWICQRRRCPTSVAFQINSLLTAARVGLFTSACLPGLFTWNATSCVSTVQATLCRKIGAKSQPSFKYVLSMLRYILLLPRFEMMFSSAAGRASTWFDIAGSCRGAFGGSQKKQKTDRPSDFGASIVASPGRPSSFWPGRSLPRNRVYITCIV